METSKPQKTYYDIAIKNRMKRKKLVSSPPVDPSVDENQKIVNSRKTVGY